MTEQTFPHVTSEGDAQTKPLSKEKLLIGFLFGIGGLATFGWVALVGWGLIYLIGNLTG